MRTRDYCLVPGELWRLIVQITHCKRQVTYQTRETIGLGQLGIKRSVFQWRQINTQQQQPRNNNKTQKIRTRKRRHKWTVVTYEDFVPKLDDRITFKRLWRAKSIKLGRTALFTSRRSTLWNWVGRGDWFLSGAPPPITSCNKTNIVGCFWTSVAPGVKLFCSSLVVGAKTLSSDYKHKPVKTFDRVREGRKVRLVFFWRLISCPPPPQTHTININYIHVIILPAVSRPL